MLKKISLIAACIMLSSCGALLPRDPRTIKGVDSSFSEELAVFETMYGKRVINIPIGFQKLDGDKVGVCTIWSNGYKQIAVDPDYWAATTKASRLALIFHELAHCELGRDHDSDLFYYSGVVTRGYVPVTLMYPYNFYNESYSELQDYYFKEIFNPSIKPNMLTKSKEDGKCVIHIDVHESL